MSELNQVIHKTLTHLGFTPSKEFIEQVLYKNALSQKQFIFLRDKLGIHPAKNWEDKFCQTLLGINELHEFIESGSKNARNKNKRYSFLKLKAYYDDLKSKDDATRSKSAQSLQVSNLEQRVEHLETQYSILRKLYQQTIEQVQPLILKNNSFHNKEPVDGNSSKEKEEISEKLTVGDYELNIKEESEAQETPNKDEFVFSSYSAFRAVAHVLYLTNEYTPNLSIKRAVDHASKKHCVPKDKLHDSVTLIKSRLEYSVQQCMDFGS